MILVNFFVDKTIFLYYIDYKFNENKINKISKENKMKNKKTEKVIIIGDRDGVPGPAIAECVKTAGGEVVFSSTECFV